MAKRNGGSGFSLRTQDATSGGGIEGALATIAEIGFVDEFTYGGRQKDKPQAALCVKYEIEGFDKPWEQNYTLGPSEKYEVVADGDGIRSVGKQAGLNKNCSAFKFFEALEAAAGDDLDELIPEIEDEEGCYSVRPLEGRQVRLTNAKFKTVSGDEKDLPVIASLEEGDAPAKSAKGKSSAKGGNLDAKTEAAVSALLEDNTSIKKGDLANMIFAENKKDADVKAMMQLCFKDSWVADESRPWTYDKKKGVLKATE
jgi:hypothetical protein